MTKGVGKGNTNNPNGRPKGVPNKATLNAREAIAEFVDGNAERLTEWLDRIAEENPKDAFNCFMSVVEYHIPKLARTEQVNSGMQEHVVSLSKEDKEMIRQSILTKIGLDE